MKLLANNFARVVIYSVKFLLREERGEKVEGKTIKGYTFTQFLSIFT